MKTKRLQILVLVVSLILCSNAVLSQSNPLALILTGTDESFTGAFDGQILAAISGGAPPYQTFSSVGSTLNPLTNLPSGVFSVSVTDANNSFISGSYVINVLGANQISVAPYVSNASCNGLNDGFIDLSISGGLPPYSFIWNTGSTSEDLSSLSAGNYTVTISDNLTGSQTFNWTYTNTGMNHTILFANPVITVNGIPLTSNCYIGVFYDLPSGGQACSGYSLWTGGTFTVAAWGDNSGSSGLANGEVFKWRIWDISTGKEYTAIPTYVNNPPLVTDTSTYISNGLSQISSLFAFGNGLNSDLILQYNLGEPPAYSVIEHLTDASTLLSSDGEIDLMVSGGAPPYSFVWSNGETTEDIVGLSAGTYFLTISDNNGCTLTDSFIVDAMIQNPLSFNVQSSDVLCFGESTGTASIINLGGTAPFSILWSTGDTTLSISNLAIGNYSVSITDSSGSFHSEQFTISQPDSISTTYYMANASSTMASDGLIDLTVFGGISPYSFTWSNGASSSNITGLIAGTYIVTITDANLCTKIESYTIAETLLNNPGWYNAITSSNHTIMFDNPTIIIDGFPASYGDYIGVFYDSLGTLACGGYSNYFNSVFTVSAWGADVGNDGFVNGEEFKWKIWDASTNTEYDAVANYQTPNLTITDTGIFAVNGISQVLSLTTSQSISPIINIITSCNSDTTFLILENNELFDSVRWNLNYPSVMQLFYIYEYFPNISDTIPYVFSAGSHTVQCIGYYGSQSDTAYPSFVVEQLPWINLGPNSAILCENNSLAYDFSSYFYTGYSFLWSADCGTYQYTDTLPTFSINQAGSYAVQVTNSCGSVSDSIEVNYTVISVNAAITNSSLTSNNGAIDITVSGGTSPYLYNWSNGATTEDIVGLSAGTYFFTISDINGCTSTDSFVVDVINFFSIVSENISCSGYADGTASVINLSGTAPYSFLWSNGETTQNIGNLDVGVFYVTVTDSLQNIGVDSVEIFSPTMISITNSSTNTTGANYSGAINLTVSGGTSPYSYQWTNGATTEDISNLGAGFYNVTVTDSNNCFQTKYIPVQINTPYTPLSFSSTTNNVSCNGDCNGSVDLTPAGGGSSYSFNWSNGETSEDISGLCPDNYTVTVSSNVGPTPICPWTPAAAYPTGSNLGGYVAVGTLNPNYFNKDDIFASFFIDQGNFVCSGISEIFITNGIYHFIIESFGDNPATPQKDGFDDMEYVNYKLWHAEDGSIEDLTATITLTYIYTNGHFCQNCGNETVYFSTNGYTIPSFSPLNIVSDFIITEPDAILFSSIITAVDPLLGNNGAIDLAVSGGTSPYTYFWQPGWQSTEDISNLSYGNYSLYLLDANACSDSAQFFVDFSSQPLPLASNENIENVLCFSDCNGSINPNISNGDLPYSYLWSNGETSENINSLCAGNYTLTVSCISDTLTVNYTITEPQPLSLDTAITQVDPVITNDGAIDLSVFGGTSPYSFSWSNGETSEDISGLIYGQYSITITDSNNCTLTDSLLVDFSGAYLSFDILSEDAICFNSSTGSAWIENIVGISPIEFLWSNGATTDSIFGLFSGEYFVTVSAANGEEITNSVIVNQPDDYQINISTSLADPVSQTPGSIDLTVSGGTQPYSFNWSDGSTTEDISQAEYGAYQITISDLNSCDTIASAFVDFNLLPNWNFNLSGNSHSIEIPANANIQINGIAADINDFIGVFYDSLGTLACGGYLIWKQNQCFLIAFGDDTTTGNPNGFANQEEFSWIIWDGSQNTEHPAAATYDLSYPNHKFWQNSGQSGLDSLQVISISGTVSSPTKSIIPVGVVILYQSQNSSYYPIEKTVIDNGDFVFKGISPGDYLLYAIPAPNNQYGIPAYYVDELSWENANSIQANASTQGIDIALKPAQSIPSGIGSISGNIYVGSDSNYNPDVFGHEWFESSQKRGEIPAQNIPVIIYNSASIPMDFQLSNSNGSFEFSNLAYGTYYVDLEKAGILCNEIEVILSEEQPQVAGIDLTIDSTAVVSGIQTIDQSIFSLYPNPAKEELIISNIPENSEVLIYTLQGQRVSVTPTLSKFETLTKFTLDISKLESGAYFLEIRIDDVSIGRKLFVKE